MLNIYGPKAYPCGTLWLRGTDLEDLPSTLTYWYLSDRYDWNHFSAFPFIPIWLDNLRSMVWSTVLKAAYKSSSTNKTTFCWSIVINISFLTLIRAVSVLWKCWYTDYKCSCKLFSFWCWINLLTSTLSLYSIWEKWQISDWSIIFNNQCI